MIRALDVHDRVIRDHIDHRIDAWFHRNQRPDDAVDGNRNLFHLLFFDREATNSPHHRGERDTIIQIARHHLHPEHGKKSRFLAIAG